MELDQDLAKEALSAGVAAGRLGMDELLRAYRSAGGGLTVEELLGVLVGPAYLTVHEYCTIASALRGLLRSAGADVWVPSPEELVGPGAQPGEALARWSAQSARSTLSVP